MINNGLKTTFQIVLILKVWRVNKVLQAVNLMVVIRIIAPKF
jgi:hypothetical protein